MPKKITTLEDLLEAVQHRPDASLLFAIEDVEIAEGYHVTELKQVNITGIDCGQNVDRRQETHIQLLYGSVSPAMSVSKFDAIARKSAEAVSGLLDHPLFVESGPGNLALRRFKIQDVVHKPDRIVITLENDRAQCRPLADLQRQDLPDEGARTRCC